jgi:SAM-dependent methyltransferase
MTVFGRDYADVYDALYRGKDYEAEAELIDRLIARHGAPRPCSVLDIGCGTGKHALALVRRGYELTGIDRSPSMLAHAREAAARDGAMQARFIEGDARSFVLNERFAVALMMFTVLGYQHQTADLDASLKTVRRHLEPGGLFIFDVWNGTAVLAQGPERRTAKAFDGTDRIVRNSSTRVEEETQLCHVHFEIQRTSAIGAVKSWSEDHTLRYFVPDELERTLARHGLELLELRRFPEGDIPPDERHWNMIGTARAA